MADEQFPPLNARSIAATRDALHAYARVLGGWSEHSRRRRKHWWNLSLRPSLCGLTTGVIYGAVDFELELDFLHGQLRLKTRTATVSEPLVGQPSRDLAAWIIDALVATGVDTTPAPTDDTLSDKAFPRYSTPEATRLHGALSSVAHAMEDFRAGIREETSPIQVWPHHFDLSMIWLPGAKVAGQDVADEESSDAQMNFGFVFGDETIPEPYFYVTAYPWPESLPDVALPRGATWHSQGFNAAVVRYHDLTAMKDPHMFLQTFWSDLLTAGRDRQVR